MINNCRTSSASQPKHKCQPQQLSNEVRLDGIGWFWHGYTGCTRFRCYCHCYHDLKSKNLAHFIDISSKHRQRHPTLLHSITKYHRFHQNPRWRLSPTPHQTSKTFTRFEDAKWQCPQSRNKPLVADVVTCRQKGQRVAPGWRFWCWCSHSRQSTWPQGTNATTGPCSYTRWSKG